jgi:LmbE family N-acetylglucosaminyl deacetylase
LMCMAAHPDDEDSETLAYYNRRFGVQTSIVLANWGEGGQNETGPELYEELGVIRSHETLNAARLVGTRNVYCLNQKDFGFSKTAEETWRFWNHGKALEDLVHILRQERPHVVITNHRIGSGHGNHQAVAELIAAAIPLAASPEAYLNQIKEEGLTPWRVLRLFQQRRHHEGLPSEEVDVSLPVGLIDPLRGVTYQDIAAEALNQHRSQGIKGVWARVNESRENSPENHFSLVLGNPPKGSFGDLFSGIPGSWWLNCQECRFPSGGNTPGISPWRKQLWDCLGTAYASLTVEPATAEKETSAAAVLLSTTTPADLSSLKAQSLRIEAMLGERWGASLEMQVSEPALVPGLESVVSLILSNRGPHTLEVEGFQLNLPAGWKTTLIRQQTGPVGPAREAEAHFLVLVPTGEAATLPATSALYRSAQPWEPNLRGMTTIKKGDIRGLGTVSRRVEIAAAWEIWIEPNNTLIPKISSAPIEFMVNVRRNTVAGATTELEVTLPDGKVQKTLLDPGAAHRSSTKVTWIPGKSLTPGAYTLTARMKSRTGEFNAEAKAAIVDLRIPPKLKVGIVQSYDTTLPDALRTLGIEHNLLGEEDLRTGNLGQFKTILIDIRGYLERPDLRGANPRLLKYVSDGGHLVVFYHKSFDWNDADPPYAPYPLHLSGARVTQEDAPVQILKPSQSFFTNPNRITASDWQGWIQERGLYFPDTYDSHYEELVSMADTGSEPLKGGILWAKYGKGTYVYTSLTWYRQLRAFVPGAYRLFTNLIAPPL